MSKPTVAVVGASADRRKFGNKSVRAHLAQGYDVYPVNPKAGEVEGLNCLIVDDLIATGGTAEAAVKLVRRSGGQVVGATFIVDLPELGGMKKLAGLGVSCHALMTFEGH